MTWVSGLLNFYKMSADLQIVPTADGSNTIYNSEVGENYHSRNGALQESQHVFLNSGLKYFIEESKNVSSAGQVGLERADMAAVSILEVGFGTGLNFLLTADYCHIEHINLNYTGIEAYPLTLEMIGQTGYDKYVPHGLWQSFINNYRVSLHVPVQINPNQLQTANYQPQTTIALQTVHCKLENFQSAIQYDIIYFDAFAAARQPEMWSDEAIAHTLQFLKPGGVFVTYAITGNLKRAIKSHGLKVEKAPGAPGKREMLRAIKPN